MKTFLIEINEEEAFVEANSKADAIDRLINTYGFNEDDIIVYHEVDGAYAEMMGLDTY